jgi:hypothetical protein
LAVGEILVGMDAIRRFRCAQTGGYQQQERLEVLITTYGRDVAVTNIVYRRIATGLIGRETKILARIPGLGFRVVSALVSLDASAGRCSADRLAAPCDRVRVALLRVPPSPNVKERGRCPTMWW